MDFVKHFVFFLGIYLGLVVCERPVRVVGRILACPACVEAASAATEASVEAEAASTTIRIREVNY